MNKKAKLRQEIDKILKKEEFLKLLDYNDTYAGGDKVELIFLDEDSAKVVFYCYWREQESTWECKGIRKRS